jgi:hypothetical protein
MRNFFLMAATISALSITAQASNIKNITTESNKERTALSAITGIPATDIDTVEADVTGTFPTITSHHGFDEFVNSSTNTLAIEIFHALFPSPEADAKLNAIAPTSQPWWATDNIEDLQRQAALLNVFLKMHDLKSDVSLYNILHKSLSVDPGYCDTTSRRQRPQNCVYQKNMIFIPLTNGTRQIKAYRIYMY